MPRRLVLSLLAVALLHLTLACQPQSESLSDRAAAAPPKPLGDTVPEFGPSAMVLHEAPNGDIWVGSWDQGAFRYDGKAIVRYDTADGLPALRVNDILSDKSGNIYFGTPQGISKFDGKAFLTLPEVQRLSESEPWVPSPDDLYFKGQEGSYGPLRYDGKWLHNMRFPKHYMADEYFKENAGHAWSPYDLYCIYRDPQGNMWFGTGNFGLSRWDGKHLEWMYEDHLQFTPSGGSFGIRSVFQDREGYYWICNTRYRYRFEAPDAPGKVEEREGNRLLRYKREPGIQGLKAPDGQDHVYFFNMIQDPQGDLWMVTYDDGIFRYDGQSTTQYIVQDGGKEYTTYAIMRDSTGNIWVGTHEGGVFRLDGEQFRRFRP